MHQQITSPPAAKATETGAPAPRAVSPRRRQSRRRRYILLGVGALILLSIIGAIIAREGALRVAEATNLPPRATMMKTEQVAKRADDLYMERTMSIHVYHRGQAACAVAKYAFGRSLRGIERAQAGASQARDQLSIAP